jgi:hypothetical protein
MAILSLTVNTRTVAVNENGYRVGEDHQRARITNGEVETILKLHEDGMGYHRIAQKFDISKSQVRNIVKSVRRCQVIARWKVIPTEPL